MTTSSGTLRRGVLSLLFGLMAAQGVMNDARAESAPHQPATPLPADQPPADEPQTQASRALERMRVYYATRAKHNVTLGVLDTDGLYTAQPDTSDDTLLRAAMLNPGTVPDAQSQQSIVKRMETVDGSYAETQGVDLSHSMIAPFALPHLHTVDGRALCIVVTAQPDIQLTIPTGLTTEQTVRYINRHEFHHCISRHLDRFDKDSKEISTTNPDGSANPAAFRQAAASLAEETRADLGAAMDMIALDGDDTSVIRGLAEWRARRMAASQHDILHYSTPALLALAERIDTMGIARFRGLSEQQRTRMAEGLVRSHSLSPGAIALALKDINYLDDDGTTLRHLRIGARDHSLVAPAQAYVRANPMIEHEDIVPANLSPDQVAALRDWDIEAQLVRRAAAPDGRLTRLGVLNARAEILDRLRQDLAADPANPIHGARILLTHGAVQHLLRGLNGQAPAAASAATMCLLSDASPKLCEAATAPAPATSL